MPKINTAAPAEEVISADPLPEATESVSSDTPPVEIKVHTDRGVGGRYVSIGGGERVWVDEGQAEEDRPKDDSFFA